MNVVANKPRRVRVAWFGGPEGRGYDILVRRYAANGVDIVEHFLWGRKGTVPAGVDAVLINTEMSSHGMFDHAREEARRLNIPWVKAGTKATRTLIELKNKGLLPMNTPEVDDDESDAMLDALRDAPPVERVTLATKKPTALATLGDVVPAKLVATLPVTAHTSTPPARVELPSATTPPASAVDRRVIVHEEWTLREDVGGGGCTLRREGRAGGVPRTPVMLDDLVFSSIGDAAAFLKVPNGVVSAALAEPGTTVKAFAVRRATFDEVAAELPRLVDEMKKPPLPAPVDVPAPTVTSKPETKDEQMPVQAVTKNDNTKRATLREQIDEAYLAMAQWPDLRRYLLPGLMKAEDDAAGVQNNEGSKR